jgi:RNA polymerase sigma factor (sigma-70 family)
MSFEGLITRLSPTLKRITWKLNGHYSYFNDEDLYQEALAHLWIDFCAGTLENKTDSYILQGCYFYLRNYLRKAEEHTTFLSLDIPDGEEGFVAEEMLNPGGTTGFEELEGRLELEKWELTCLAHREREVLPMLVDGMTMREIGHELGISHVMVLKIRNRIRDKYLRFSAETSN